MRSNKRYLTVGVTAAVILLVVTGCTAAPGMVTSDPAASQTASVSASAATSSSESEQTQDAEPEAASTEAAVRTAEYRKISATAAKEQMDAEDVVILDVRTAEEYAQGYISGAVLLPDYEIASKAETVLPDKDATILLYCRSGNRSANAARKLVEMGYTGIYDFGGIIDWPYDVVIE